MSDTTTTDPAQTQTDPPADPPASGAQGLRAQAEKATALESENATLQRELAFAKAGVPEEGAIASLFRQSYDGAATPEAVTERWSALTAELHASGVSTDPGTSAAAAVAGAHATAQVGVPGQVPPPPAEDPIKVGYEEFRKAKAQGVPDEDASSHVIGRIMSAAFSPDQAQSDRFVLINVPGHGEMTRAQAKAQGLV